MIAHCAEARAKAQGVRAAGRFAWVAAVTEGLKDIADEPEWVAFRDCLARAADAGDACAMKVVSSIARPQGDSPPKAARRVDRSDSNLA